MKIQPLAFLFFALALMLGCKGDLLDPADDPAPPTLDLLDSVDMLFEDVFLWNEEMDRTIKPAKNGDRDRSLRTFIDRRALSAIDPRTSVRPNIRRSQSVAETQEMQAILVLPSLLCPRWASTG